MIAKMTSQMMVVGLAMVATLLCLKGDMDSDLYWHMATGRWILENWQFPTQDSFSFVYSGAAWINLPWLFQIGTYTSMENFGYLGVLLLGAFFYVSSALLSWFSYRKISQTAPSLLVWLLCCGLFLLLERRWLPRPEMATHFFLALEIFILVNFCLHSTSTRWLWILPVLHIFWVNSHGMFILGPILMGLILLRYPRQMVIPFVLTLLATCVNPYGWHGALYPFYLRQVSADPIYRLISEGSSFLDSGVSKTWYISWAFWIASLGFSFSVGRKVMGWVYFIWVAFAIYFSTTMVRNLSPSVLMTAPFILAGLAELSARWIRKEISPAYKIIAVSFCTLIFSGLIVSSQLDFVRDSFHFGVEVGTNGDLKDAADFLDAKNIQSPMFATPEFSNYMLWRRKDFKTYIDTRYAEVVPRDHFQKMFRLFLNPSELEKEAVHYQLPIVAINHTLANYHGAIRYFLSSTQWRPVYLDHFMVIFLHNSYLPNLPALTAENIKAFLQKEMQTWSQSSSSQEFVRTRAYKVLVAATLFGQDKEVLAQMENAEDKMNMRLKNLYCSILTYSARGGTALEETKRRHAEKAVVMCAEALAATNDQSAAYNQAAAQVVLGQFSQAKESIERALQLNPQAFGNYLLKIEILKGLDATAYKDEIVQNYQTSLKLNPFQLPIWIDLIQMYKSQGAGEQANATLKMAKQFYPQSEELRVIENIE